MDYNFIKINKVSSMDHEHDRVNIDGQLTQMDGWTITL